MPARTQNTSWPICRCLKLVPKRAVTSLTIHMQLGSHGIELSRVRVVCERDMLFICHYQAARSASFSSIKMH
eukprot:6214047-Pleurochrysis_carterae.AAC.3